MGSFLETYNNPKSPGLLSSRHAIFSSSQKTFRSHLMILKCTFAMWLPSICLITRDISEEMVDCEQSLFRLLLENL